MDDRGLVSVHFAESVLDAHFTPLSYRKAGQEVCTIFSCSAGYAEIGLVFMEAVKCKCLKFFSHRRPDP